MRVLFKESAGYGEITVCDTAELYGEKGSFRVMQFSDGALQGAMDLLNPERIVFEYPRAIVHLMEFNNPAFEDVFAIGHGIGTIAGHFPRKHFKVAELDGMIVELSRRYFGYRMENVVVGDGRRILESEQSCAYDYIIVYAFTDKGTPPHLITREFFETAGEKLDAGGSIIMNVMGKTANDRLIGAIQATLREAFAYTKAFALPADGAAEIRNMILMGSGRPIGFRARQMAGFVETEPGAGRILTDGGY